MLDPIYFLFKCLFIDFLIFILETEKALPRALPGMEKALMMATSGHDLNQESRTLSGSPPWMTGTRVLGPSLLFPTIFISWR